MKEYISKDTMRDIVSGFYGRFGSDVDNVLADINATVSEYPAAQVVETRPLRYDPHMEQLLKEAGWE